MEREQAKKKKKNERSAKGGGDSVFEFCEVCNRNHDQGRRHKYFPSHARSLSALLAKSQNKISKLRCFLRNPSVLRSEDSGLERFWCVFCGLEVGELDGAFACGNAFYHLASSEHLKNLKDFLLKHGGGMDRVDSFRVMEADLIKWEKACRSLKSAASPLREAPIGVVPNLSKEIKGLGYAIQTLVGPQLLVDFPMPMLPFQSVCREIWFVRTHILLGMWLLIQLKIYQVYSSCLLVTPAEPLSASV